MYAKAAMLLVAGSAAAALLILRSPDLTTAALVAIAIWAFCRAYYFVFYVIERYIDRSYRFSGLLSVVKHLVTSRVKPPSGGRVAATHCGPIAPLPDGQATQRTQDHERGALSDVRKQ